ncbi:biotin transporter BioY [Candidatus Protochlamydia amoebophila]|uniref:Biotin transporter n=1 Tax=Protochlamydia amoebophila (strain UWE25) TaxID=264201 RepID=Q6MA52_PARUW|nr:biotin transporter BioY [Candidatus Protochlamydia amoebophila]CAF24547.1 unnamed protein product [Candidatus Protochlamydia amoebophila UWE25]
MANSVDLSHVDESTNSLIKNWSVAFQVLAASFFLALCAQIKIALPFTPIPLTMQTLAVMIIGVTLGKRNGVWAILAYFAEIAVGMPVLSNFEMNPLVFFGPKAGYIFGFLAQVYLMGWAVEKMKKHQIQFLALMGFVACITQLAIGVLGLAPFVGWKNVIMMGFYPFIGGEILKIFLLCISLKTLRKSI